MTDTKEKAQELITKFSPLVTTWDCYWDTERNEDLVIADAKQCALIAVEEIIKTLYVIEGSHEAVSSRYYWIDVKKQIEKS